MGDTGSVLKVNNVLSSVLISLLCLTLIGASFIIKLNFGEKAGSESRIIEYTYQNEGDDNLKRNRFRKIQIKIENLINLMDLDTKKVRISVHRSGEINDGQLLCGEVFGVILDNLVKMDAIIFDHKRCVQIDAQYTKLTMFLLMDYNDRIAIHTMVIVIDRQTDTISVVGKELSADDIWTNALVNTDILNHANIRLDKGFLRVLGEKVANAK